MAAFTEFSLQGRAAWLVGRRRAQPGADSEPPAGRMPGGADRALVVPALGPRRLPGGDGLSGFRSEPGGPRFAGRQRRGVGAVQLSHALSPLGIHRAEVSVVAATDCRRRFFGAGAGEQVFGRFSAGHRRRCRGRRNVFRPSSPIAGKSGRGRENQAAPGPSERSRRGAGSCVRSGFCRVLVNLFFPRSEGLPARPGNPAGTPNVGTQRVSVGTIFDRRLVVLFSGRVVGQDSGGDADSHRREPGSVARGQPAGPAGRGFSPGSRRCWSWRRR